MSVSRLPVLFIGHGSPMNALADNDFTRTLSALGKKLPRPRAVLCVSAHWYGDGVSVSSASKPETIHDFYGFPEELFQVRYPAPGHPELARRAWELLSQSGAQLTEDWGLDHGAWSVLRHIFPLADVPVFQLSLDRWKEPDQHFKLAEQLKPLRSEGVLIVGSGNVVHNLGELNPRADAAPYPWAERFDAALKHAVLNRDVQTLTEYMTSFEDAVLAAPTPDHYLPFLYALAASDAQDAITFPYEGFEHGSISLRAVQWGGLSL